jgi:hypothetical protein
MVLRQPLRAVVPWYITFTRELAQRMLALLSPSIVAAAIDMDQCVQQSGPSTGTQSNASIYLPLHEDPNVHVCAVSQRLFAVPHGANAQTRAETKLPSNPVALATVERQHFAKSVNAPEKVIAGKRETTRRSLTLFAYILFSERSSVASARGPVRR